MQWFAKPPNLVKGFRGFESLSLRHFSVRKPLINSILLFDNDLLFNRKTPTTRPNATPFKVFALTVP